MKNLIMLIASLFLVSCVPIEQQETVTGSSVIPAISSLQKNAKQLIPTVTPTPILTLAPTVTPTHTITVTVTPVPTLAQTVTVTPVPTPIPAETVTHYRTETITDGYASMYADGVMDQVIAYRTMPLHSHPDGRYISNCETKMYVVCENYNGYTQYTVTPDVYSVFGNRFIAVLNPSDALLVWCVTVHGVSYNAYAIDWSHPDLKSSDAQVFSSNGFIFEMHYSFYWESGANGSAVSKYLGWCQ